jgi:hypothetical protein
MVLALWRRFAIKLQSSTVGLWGQTSHKLGTSRTAMWDGWSCKNGVLHRHSHALVVVDDHYVALT